MRESATLVTKLGDFEVKPWFLDDGSLYVALTTDDVTVRGVSMRGITRLVLKDPREGFEPQVDSGYARPTWEANAMYAAHFTRNDNYKDATRAAVVAITKELVKELNIAVKDKSFRELTLENTEQEHSYDTKRLSREIAEAEAKVRELKAELKKVKKKSPDYFKKLGV